LTDLIKNGGARKLGNLHLEHRKPGQTQAIGLKPTLQPHFPKTTLRSNPPNHPLPFNILKNKPQNNYSTETRFIAETAFTEANYTPSCFSNSNFANYSNTNYPNSNLAPNFTNSAHVYKQTRPRKKQQFPPKNSPQHLHSTHRDLESVFNPPVIPSRFSTEKSQIKPVKDQFRVSSSSTPQIKPPILPEKLSDGKVKKRKKTGRRKSVKSNPNSQKGSQNSLIDNDLDVNQTGDRLLGREQQDKTQINCQQTSENEKIRPEKLKKLRPQQTRPIIPLRNEKLFYSIESLQSSNKPKIKPLFKQPLLSMDKQSDFIGIHTSPGQKINLDVNRALENLLIENPDGRPKTPERKVKPRDFDPKNEDSEDDKCMDSDSSHDEFSDSMMNTVTEMDLDENDGNLTDESDHDLPATPPNEEKQQVAALWPTKFAKHCEPTIRFIRSKEEVSDDLKLPPDQLAMLKWQGSKICPKIMKSLLSKTGFKIYKHTKQWIGYYGKHMKSPLFEKFQAGQHVNHFPGTFELGRKDRLFRNVNRLAAKRTRNVSSHKLHMINSGSTFSANQISQGSTKNYNSIYNPSYNPTYNSAYSGSSILPSSSNPNVLNSSNSKLIPKPDRFVLENFDFLPQTYILPQDRDKLRREWSDGTRFISKPCASARGIGIKVLNKFSQLPTVFKNERLSASTNRKLLVQKYLQKPMLLNGHKFDLRLYVVITSYDPLSVYLYDNGLVRLASHAYTKNNLKNRYAHLTNYSINKNSKDFIKNDEPDATKGHKWTLKALMKQLREEHGDPKVDELWAMMTDIIVKTFLAVESHVNSLVLRHLKEASCFEVFGVDILVDDKFKPWLIEVNVSPSLNQNSKLDLYVKEGMMADALNLVGFRVPKTEIGETLSETTLGVKLGSKSESKVTESKLSESKLFEPKIPELKISESKKSELKMPESKTSEPKISESKSSVSKSSETSKNRSTSAISTSTSITPFDNFKNEYKYLMTIKSKNRGKRSKFMPKWTSMVLGERLAIVEDLSEEDKHILRKYEDEIERCGDYIPVFPPMIADNLFAYDELFERPRYSNCLIQAWNYKKASCNSSNKLKQFLKLLQ